MASRIPTSSFGQRPQQSENIQPLYPEIQTTEKVAVCFKCKMHMDQNQMHRANGGFICDPCSKRWSWRSDVCIDIGMLIGLGVACGAVFFKVLPLDTKS